MGTPAVSGGGEIRVTGDVREASPRKCVCLSCSATEDPDRDVGAVRRAGPRLKNMCGSRDGLLQLLGAVDGVGTRAVGIEHHEPRRVYSDWQYSAKGPGPY
jgi:hypothetical protein